MAHPAATETLDQLSLWTHPLLQMIAAGWTTADDVDYLIPLLRHAARVRSQVAEYANLPVQVKADYLEELALWPAPKEEAPLPTFALYFQLQCQLHCQAGQAASHAMLQDYANAQIKHVLQRAWHKKHVDFAAPDTSEPDNGTATPELAALALLQRWFDDLFQGLRHHRVAALSNKIQAKQSLQEKPGYAMSLNSVVAMRAEKDDKRNQDFSVTRLPCTGQTLDPRIVRIAPGKYNNLHRHAHETLFCMLQGEGEILVGEQWVPFKAGEAVFAPRWAMHQTHNTGSCELVMYAITDYYLSNQVFIGANSTTVLG